MIFGDKVPHQNRESSACHGWEGRERSDFSRLSDTGHKKSVIEAAKTP